MHNPEGKRRSLFEGVVMSKIAEIFGYQSRDKRYYLDLALWTVAIIASVWTLGGILSADSEYDGKVTAVSAGVAVAAILLSSNRLVGIGVVLGYFAVRGLIALAETGEMRLVPVIAVAVVGLVVVGVIGNRRGKSPN